MLLACFHICQANPHSSSSPLTTEGLCPVSEAAHTLMPVESEEELHKLVNLLASRFIQRRKPYAIQVGDGGYRPNREGTFNRQLLWNHLTGVQTVGHYLLDESDQCKLFVLDIDLRPADPDHKNAPGYLPTVVLQPDPNDQEIYEWESSFRECWDLRAAWHDRRNLPARQYLKKQMRQLAGIFTAHIYNFMKLDTAACYSGNKGIHVYGFTGSGPASTARDYAELLVQIPGWLTPTRGGSFYGDSRPTSPETYGNWHFEIYPKQSSLEGKDLGNLIRLPLGRNLHSPKDPTFFIDLAAPLSTLTPVNPVFALTTGNAWLRSDETVPAN
jgi:hypothetical protein